MNPVPARLLRPLVLLAATVPVVAACGAPVSRHHGGGASCAAVVVYRGATYLGTGELKRDPATTGRHVAGLLPGCDDSGGQLPATPEESVQVDELVDVPLATAFRWQGTVYVREGRRLPPGTRAWFRSPRCTTATVFEVRADWLGVTGPRKPRFDGDLRPPYRVRVHVTEGPRRYVGAVISVHADATTEPGLAPADVKASLDRGGQVVARVECEVGRFRALGLRVPRQR